MYIRNAPIEGMEKLGYGQGYLYPHDYPGNYVEQQYLPEKIKDKKYYVPGENDKLKINPQKLEQKEKSKKQVKRKRRDNYVQQ